MEKNKSCEITIKGNMQHKDLHKSLTKTPKNMNTPLHNYTCITLTQGRLMSH